MELKTDRYYFSQKRTIFWRLYLMGSCIYFFSSSLWEELNIFCHSCRPICDERIPVCIMKYVAWWYIKAEISVLKVETFPIGLYSTAQSDCLECIGEHLAFSRQFLLCWVIFFFMKPFDHLLILYNWGLHYKMLGFWAMQRDVGISSSTC